MTTVSDWLRAAPRAQDLDYAARTADAIYAWCLNRIGFHPGDQVRVTADVAASQDWSPGWWAYRECLASGATATVVEVDFNLQTKSWQVGIRLDREWSVSSDGTTRWWHGPVSTTPQGYRPPSIYDQEHSPDGTRGLFYLYVENLERIELRDLPG